MDLPVAADRELQEVGQSVHYRNADAVKSAGDLVRRVVELTAGVQHGHDDLGRRSALLRHDVDRDSTAVIGDRDGLVGMNGDDYPVTVTGKRLIDGVVDHLENHVVQTRAVIGVSDVHTGAFPHRVQAS